MTADSERVRWIALYERIFDNEVLAKGEFDWRSAYIWLIVNAAWRDHTMHTRGGMIELKRGQIPVAREHLAKVFRWTDARVRHFLKILAANHMIEFSQRDNQYTAVATICNYDKYQGMTERLPRAKQPAKDQRNANEKPYITKDTKETIDIDMSPKGESAISADVREAFEAWNATAGRHGLPMAVKLTADRARKIRARLADYGLDGWRNALGNIEASAFLTGRTSHGFRADLDFVCRPERFGKLIDGAYAGANGANHGPPVITDADGVAHRARY